MQSEIRVSRFSRDLISSVNASEARPPPAEVMAGESVLSGAPPPPFLLRPPAAALLVRSTEQSSAPPVVFFPRDLPSDENLVTKDRCLVADVDKSVVLNIDLRNEWRPSYNLLLYIQTQFPLPPPLVSAGPQTELAHGLIGSFVDEWWLDPPCWPA
jgi:hypothetical protein